MADDMKIEQDGARYYIPLSPRWEVQTKGNGSSFRIAERKDDGHRMLVPESPYLHDFIEQMAREVNADYAAALAQIEGLKAERDEATVRTAAHYEKCIEAIKELHEMQAAALREQLAAAKRDAERYRWLRKIGNGPFFAFKEDVTLDQAIDISIDATRTPSAAQGGSSLK